MERRLILDRGGVATDSEDASGEGGIAMEGGGRSKGPAPLPTAAQGAAAAASDPQPQQPRMWMQRLQPPQGLEGVKNGAGSVRT